MHKIRTKIFYTSILGFIIGTAFRSFFDLGFSFEIFIFFLAILFFLFWFFSEDSQKKIYIIIVSIFLISSTVGMFRYSLSDLNKGDPILDKVVGDVVSVEGVISGEPIEKEKYTKVVLDTGTTKINLLIDSFLNLKYGDNISVSGKLQKPKNFDDFDYISYLEKDEIFYQMYYPEIELVSEGGGSFIKRKLFEIKNKFLTSLGEILPEPHSALMGGLTVGAQESMGEKLVEDFRRTGIIHIVVLSGYNITIVADSITKIFAFLPGIFSSVLGIISIILFALMTGASATIVRASIMAGLVVLARVFRRKYDISRALSLAGALMIFHNPKILAFDPSFQLSFVATIGLLYISPIIARFFKFITEKWNFRELIVSAIATQIFVLPLLLYKMGMLSFVSIPVNVLVLPLVPVTMLFGFLSGVTNFFISFLALPFSWISYILLEFELGVVDIFSSLSFASIEINNFPLWLMIFIYLIYGTIFYVMYNKKKSYE